MATTAQRIKKGMEMRGYKQADLVEKTGISKGAISSYLSGRYSPKQTNIYLIAKALNVSVAWLMGADVPPTKEMMCDADSNNNTFNMCAGCKCIFNHLHPQIER